MVENFGEERFRSHSQPKSSPNVKYQISIHHSYQHSDHDYLIVLWESYVQRIQMSRSLHTTTTEFQKHYKVYIQANKNSNDNDTS